MRRIGKVLMLTLQSSVLLVNYVHVVAVAAAWAKERDVNFLRRLPQALELAALEVGEDGRNGVDLGQAEAEKIERAHLQYDERAAVLAEGEEDGARLHHNLWYK